MSRFTILCVTSALLALAGSAVAQENWNPAVNLGPAVNSPLTEKAPCISPDGQTLYFHHDTGMGDINIFYCQWSGSAWGPPVDMGVPVNSPQNDYGPTITGDGNKLYFASNRPGGYGGYDICMTERIGGIWQSPVNIGPAVNSGVSELGQDISTDDTVLWFSRGWPEPSPTDEDIYYSTKVGGQWTTPVPWELNTVYLEDNPNISADGTRLYFTAIYDTLYGGGTGSFDIWVSENVGGVWQQPVNLGPNINTSGHDANPSISFDDGTLYFTRNDPNGYGGFDLYYATGVDPCAGTLAAPALVTVQTAGPEQFVIRVVDQVLLDQMIDICLGVAPQKIVLGDLLPGSAGFNRDPLNGNTWSWHLDEHTIVLAEFTIELCDGLPSFVEANLPYWLDSVGFFCPWTSRIVAIQPDPSLPGDLDCDGAVDVGDIAPFAIALIDPVGFYGTYPDCSHYLADMNNSGTADGDDIRLFVAAIVGP